MRKLITICVLFSISMALKGQMVQNKSYAIMLKSLLTHDVIEISAKDAKKDTGAIFLDAREKKEYNVSHIKNAIWVGYDDFDLSRVKSISKNKKIMVYCSVGYRSEKVAKKLNAGGYTNVSNIVGGIFEWKNLNYSVVDNNGNETEKVHTYNKTWGVWLNNGVKVYD